MASNDYELRDSRGRIVVGTMAVYKNGKFCYVCHSCEGEFLTASTCEKHIELVHQQTKNESTSEPMVIEYRVLRKELPVIEIISEDEKMEVISISSSDDETDENQNEVLKVTDNTIGQPVKESTRVESTKDESTSTQEQSTRKVSTQKESDDESESDSEYSTPVSSDGNLTDDDENNKTKKRARFTCNYCPKKFNRLLDLNKHLASDCANYNKMFITCDYCPKKYRHLSSKRQHMLKEHQDKLPHVCKVCPRSFGTKTELNEHSAKMHSSGKIVNCNFCKKEFLSCYERNNHVRDHHKNMANKFGEFVCPICDYTCKTEQILRAHKRDVHENVN